PDQVMTLITRLNGEEVQRTTTDLLIHSIPSLIAHISCFTELEAGDVIVTGTPGGVGFKRQPPLYMRPGDVVEVEVDALGVLRNPIEAEMA
ncbi:MAG: fumarylacetoacetate hydrolase family protein, partial [Brevundimonas aurantiaca]